MRTKEADAAVKYVNECQDAVGMWFVQTAGSKGYEIQETIGPGLAKSVKTSWKLNDLYIEAAAHNRDLQKN